MSLEDVVMFETKVLGSARGGAARSSEGQRRTGINNAKTSSANLAINAVPVGDEDVLDAMWAVSSRDTRPDGSESSFERDRRPNKEKIKSIGELHRCSFPPEFWDGLSKVPLTSSAVLHGPRHLQCVRPIALGLHDAAAQIFAISEGVPYRKELIEPWLLATLPQAGDQIDKRSSAYDKAFEQHLNDNNVYLHGRNRGRTTTQTRIRQGRRFHGPGSPTAHLNTFRTNMIIWAPKEITTVDLKPDFYDGARFSDIDATVRCPAAPNFFLEAKAPWAGADIAKRQASLGGAISARAMHALQNYGDEEPDFDGNAYSYSSTYHAGIEAEVPAAETRHYEESTCEDYVGPQAIGTENYAASHDLDDGPALTLYAEGKEPSQGSTSLGPEPAMSFDTSFGSSFSAQRQTSSKRNRAPHSPPSNAQPHKKHGSAKRRTRQSASRRTAGSSTRASASTGSAVPQPSSNRDY
ncbi:hypothetical protein B0T26DRAFT_681137 [Lasiosphaeria miniovina]|uniref:Uncharacterized protein n=1 Tax=Lasiosphaeria miniovina TaxID=1954250 RepID=A0AA39ZTL1_9PEZI|nr:uncharacterized protein B0T26DRAFT_681137 [Lasiosphaeria miniovina]KAK0703471.1 hypothetical protein B0T26DRAFT_681137 [Lasiosphaeria miniovina]